MKHSLICLLLSVSFILFFACRNKKVKLEEASEKISAGKIEYKNVKGLAVLPGYVKEEKLSMSEKGNDNVGSKILLVDEVGGMSMLRPDIYAEDLTSIVGHVIEVTTDTTLGKAIKFDVFSRSVVDSPALLASRIKVPLNSTYEEHKATKKQIADAKLVFLDGSISDDEFYTYTDQPISSLNLKDQDVVQTRLLQFQCPSGTPCNRYIVEWAQIRQIVTNKYKKSDKNAKIKNLPPFVSAVLSGGDFATMRENSDKKIMNKLLISIVPIKYWIH